MTAKSETYTVVVLPPGWAKEVTKRLDRIERAIGATHQEEERHMSELDDRLADLAAVQNTNTASLARLITDFENAGKLTPAQRDALDAIKNEVVGNAAAIDAVDPAAPPAV